VSAAGLAERLREATRPMHRLAERSGIMRAMLRGDVAAPEYCLLLRNLHALYAALERQLDRHADLPALAPVRFPVLFRSTPLVEDLRQLHGPDWSALPLADAMHAYVARIGELGDREPPTLAAHAYVRYMGDLSGGLLVGDVVRRALLLTGGAGTAFYDFGDADEALLKARFRAALDALPLEKHAQNAIVLEANGAFARHVRLFEELDAAPRR
jgi:heme oxygenase